MRTLITGASGTLGSYLVRHAGYGDAIGTSHNKRLPGLEPLDLTDRAETDRLLDGYRPDHIIHTVAMTDVDRCQEQPAEAYRITVLTTAHLVSWIRDRSPGTRLTYVSTDHVYDGPGPHGEEVVRPGNVYALTKLWAEALAQQVQAYVVLRVNFFGPGGEARDTLSDWLLRGLQEGRSLRLFHDVYFSPLYLEHVADAIYECGVKDVRGTFNLGASGGGVSKAGFAALLADTFGLSMESTTSGSVADARLTAYRPSDMRMRVDRLEARLGHRLPSIREGLALMRARMEGSKA